MKFRRNHFALWFRAVVLPGLLAMAGPSARGGTPEPSPVMVVEPVYGWDSNYCVGSWIWDAETHDRQECRFWKAFTVPDAPDVESAQLRITADNFCAFTLDGHVIGKSSDWRSLIEHDVTALLEPGPHVLAVSGLNDYDVAGIVAGLQIKLTDGRVIQIGTDESWRVVPLNVRRWNYLLQGNPSWKPALVVTQFTRGPWQTGGVRIFKAPPVQLPEAHFWEAAWFLITVAAAGAIFFLVCIYLASRLALQSQRQMVVKRERARIAKDLHDELTGGLNRLVLLVETARNDLPPQSERWQHLARACEHTRTLMRTINETIWLINSQRDSLKDFASYVSKYAETFFQPTAIRCRFDIEPDLPPFPCDVGTRRCLFLAVKEALNNVLRHSQGTEVHIRMRLKSGKLIVEVQDNGRGFDPSATGSEGNGLGNMRQRAQEAGGECYVASQPGAGCSVEFHVSLNPSRWRGPRWLKQRSPPPLPSSATTASVSAGTSDLPENQ